MNKLLPAVILILTMAGCKKDAAAGNQQIDYSAFLNQTGQRFEGKLDGASFSWSYGWNQFQGIAGYENGNGICDSADPVRVVLFGLSSEDGGQTRFRLYSPKYNSTAEAEFTRVFSPGKKKLGDFRTDFYLSINKDNNFYQSNRFDATNEIEILKTQEFADYLGKKMRVWFSIHAKLSSCSCQSNTSTLADGLMVAEFYGYKKGQ